MSLPPKAVIYSESARQTLSFHVSLVQIASTALKPTCQPTNSCCINAGSKNYV